jgi:hypothetical protein
MYWCYGPPWRGGPARRHDSNLRLSHVHRSGRWRRPSRLGRPGGPRREHRALEDTRVDRLHMQFQSLRRRNLAVPGRRWTATDPATSAENWNPNLASTVRITTAGMGLGADASGFISAGGPASAAQTHALIQEIRRRPGLRTRIMVGDDDAAVWASVTPDTIYSTARTAQVLDLHGGFSTVWSERFTSKVRSNARKAERRGVVVESDNTGRLVPVFDELYRSSVDRWAQQRGHPLSLMRWRAQRSEPRSKFETVARMMGERCTVWIAWRGGEPLAGIFVLTRGPRATYWRGVWIRNGRVAPARTSFSTATRSRPRAPMDDRVMTSAYSKLRS